MLSLPNYYLYQPKGIVSVGSGSITQHSSVIITPAPECAICFNSQAEKRRSNNLFQFISVPTCTGVLKLVFVPFPSSPKLLSPQAHKVPSVLMARLWVLPAEMSFHEEVPTCTGALFPV